MADHIRPFQIEGFAIVSDDGMLANAAGVMPDSLKFEADKRFFENGLDRMGVVVHGKHSHEQQPHSDRRQRLILTTRIPAIAVEPSLPKAHLWNPAGLPLEQALADIGVTTAKIGIIGGTHVFDLFLDRYDVFHLTRAPGVRLPGGRPVFSGVPKQTPEQVLAANGLMPGRPQTLDAANTIKVVSWHRDGSKHTPITKPIAG